MRKLDVTNYTVTEVRAEGKVTLPYDTKEALITCLFHPSLKLSAREVLIRNQIGAKIEGAKGFVLLEETEYEKLRTAVDSIEGFSKNEVELINRVFNAEVVQVEVK